MGISNIVSLLGGVALFLFGMSLMSEGLKKVAGNKLEMVLWNITNTNIKGVLVGTIVTAIIQSSSATTVMVIGFVNSGMMKVAQAISIIMGANIGTSITGWIMCLSYMDSANTGVLELLSTATLSALIALIGIILKMFTKSKTKHNIGTILLGFSVLMFGMQSMSSAVAPLKESETFLNILTMFSNPIIGILCGIVITAILQSASASVGILQALSVTGTINFSMAIPIIMGMGIGASMPVLISSIGTNKDGKRTALIYLFNDVFGTIIWSTVFYTSNAIVHYSFLQNVTSPIDIALINTIFRVATTLVLMPFIKYLEKLVFFVVKDDPNQENKDKDLERLNENFLDTPEVAIEQSSIVLLSMATLTKKNVSSAIQLLYNYSEDEYKNIESTEDIVDKYEDKIGSYLVKITTNKLLEPQRQNISLMLHAIGDFERISDYSVSISDSSKELFEKDSKFSQDAKADLNILELALKEALDNTIIAYKNYDLDTAYKVTSLKELISILYNNAKNGHILRIQNGSCTLEQGFIFNDLITNYQRISDHCYNIAISIIELKARSLDTKEYLQGLNYIKSDSLNKYLKEYQKKYQLQ